jgi:outer membrane protein assembly complex protein YaeT
MKERASSGCRVVLGWALPFLVSAGLGAAGTALAEERSGVVRFRGNEAFDQAWLREEAKESLTSFSKTGRRSDADDAAWQVENAYLDEGYASVEVRYDYVRSEAGASVTYLITEGPRVLLERIDLLGDDELSEEDLMKFFEAGGNQAGEPFIASKIEEAARSVQNYYYGKGYIEAAVSNPLAEFSPDGLRAVVTVKIEEGPRHVVRSVSLAGDVLPAVEEPFAKLAGKLEGSVYRTRERTLLSSRVNEIYQEAGYPDVKVEVEVGRGEEAGDVTLEAIVASGVRVRITGVSIAGNERTKDNFIMKKITVGAGEWYDKRKVVESLTNLGRTGIFSTVEPSFKGEEGAEERDMVFRVEEAPSRGVGLEVGWGSYEKARARAAFQEKNLLGRGLLAKAEAGGSTKSRFAGIQVVDTAFLGTKFTASIPVDYTRREEPTYTEKTFEGSLVATRKLSGRVTTSFKYSFQSTETTNIEAEEPEPNRQENYNLGRVRFLLGRDSRNSPFYPARGNKSSLALEIADPALGGEISFLIFTFSDSAFFSLGKRTVLALSLETGLIYPTEEGTAIPIAERFFNGGESTVRSFEESQIGPRDLEGDVLGGLGYNVLNVELRHRVKGSFGLTLFFDAGNVAPNLSPVEQGLPPFENATEAFEAALDDFFSDFRTGLGVGFQYLLPVGPLRVDWAWNPAPREGEEDWVVHLTLGMAF